MRTGWGVFPVLCALALAGCGGRAPLGPSRLTSGPGDKTAPAFSPDGKSVVFVKRMGDNETQLFVVGLDRRAERRLTFVPSENGEPAWSHDGSRIAFQSNRGGATNVYIVAADVGEAPGCPEAFALTRDEAHSGAPTWSHDDSRLAFESDRRGNADIYAVKADGDNVVLLTQSPTDDTTPAWSPDGKLIAFASGRAGSRDIWMMDPDGSLPRQLTTDPGAEWRPRWTPDSRQVVFMRAETPGRVEFYEVLHTGEGFKQVIASAADLRDPVVSPDGKWLAFSANPDGQYEIYLLRLGR